MSAMAESERNTKSISFPFAVLPKVPFTWVRPAVAFADALITVAASLICPWNMDIREHYFRMRDMKCRL